MIKYIEQGIMAIVPEYVENKGNCSKLYVSGMESVVLEKNIKSVIKQISKYYMLDLNQFKIKYSTLVSSPNLVPIAFSRLDVFVPIKTRIPMYKNDGAFAYVNIRYIENIKKCKENVKIYLSNGISINCLCTMETVNKHMRNGKIVQLCYHPRESMIAESEVIYNAKILINK